MNKTILITGSSSGIGKAIAIFFADKNWNVAATMRSPNKERDLIHLKNVKLYPLDVTDVISIQNTIEVVIEDFGNIDVIVNNAGYGAVGIFEKSTDQQIRRQFEVNVFGALNVIRGVLPHFRSKKSGTIINITSVGALVAFPLYSAYHATKWALDGFGESLHYELRSLGIKVKNIEPGVIKTDFYSRSQDVFENNAFHSYDDYEKVCTSNTKKTEKNAQDPIGVAKVVWKAANSKTNKLRYVSGFDAKALLFIRRMIPNSWFFGLIRGVVEKGFESK